MPPRKKPTQDNIPVEVCGVCRYGKGKGKEYYCWESAPVPVWEDGVPDFKRGFPVEMDDVACSLFKPRFHS